MAFFNENGLKDIFAPYVNEKRINTVEPIKAILKKVKFSLVETFCSDIQKQSVYQERYNL